MSGHTCLHDYYKCRWPDSENHILILGNYTEQHGVNYFELVMKEKNFGIIDR